MRRLAALALCCTMSALASATAAAEVRVAFVAPEHYTDASLHDGYGAAGRAPALHEIEQTLHRLGGRYLRPEQTLSIEVLDVDLAGRFESWRFQAHDIRFMREVTWPRIKLRYRLTETGQPLRTGEEEVADQNYLMDPAVRASIAVMPYEKAMLEDWFRVRFADGRMSSR